MLEEHLYAGEHEDGAAAEMYPGYLVLLTSAAGATLTHRLARARRLSRVAAWALHCVFASKLTMLLVPEARPAEPLHPAAGNVKPVRSLPDQPCTASSLQHEWTSI